MKIVIPLLLILLYSCDCKQKKCLHGHYEYKRHYKLKHNPHEYYTEHWVCDHYEN